MKQNVDLLFIIVCALVAFITWLDVITYMFKRSPKSAMCYRWFWWLGYLATIYLAYHYITTTQIPLSM